jgi:hypothetical protein
MSIFKLLLFPQDKSFYLVIELYIVGILLKSVKHVWMNFFNFSL